MITERTRLIDVTVGDLVDYFRQNGLLARQEPRIEYKGPETVKGIEGLAGLLGCSVSTAQRRKNSGEFNGAIRQSGRKITVDVRKVLAIMEKEARI